MREPRDQHRFDSVVQRRGAYVFRRTDPVAFRAEHHHGHSAALGQLPMQPQRQVHQGARRFGAKMQTGLDQQMRGDVVAEIKRLERLQYVRGKPGRVELAHLHQVIWPFGRESCCHGQQSGRWNRGNQRCSAYRARSEEPFDHGGAHRMTDQYRRDGQLRRDALYIGRVVVQSCDKKAAVAAGGAMSP